MPSLEVRLASIETIVTRLDRHLIGEDGNGGLIQALKDADEENKLEIGARHKENQEAIQKINIRVVIMGTVAMTLISVLSFLAGSRIDGLGHMIKLFAQ